MAFVSDHSLLDVFPPKLHQRHPPQNDAIASCDCVRDASAFLSKAEVQEFELYLKERFESNSCLLFTMVAISASLGFNGTKG